MSPLERVQARTAALEALGLEGSASSREIRKAWKRVAFETHPDRSAGETAAFLRAKTAFEYLGGSEKTFGASDPGEPALHAVPTAMTGLNELRPSVVVRTEKLSNDDIKASWELLYEEPADSATDHVVEVIQRMGRSLTYVVPSPAASGLNRVALPAAILSGYRRKICPTVVSFELADAKIDQFLVPEKMRLDIFPGAWNVCIRFGASSDQESDA